MSLQVIADLNHHFQDRQIEFFTTKSPFTLIDTGTKQYVQIYDTNLSVQLLSSKKLIAFSYYSQGIDELANAGKKLPHLQDFWKNSLLFINGPEHKKLKFKLLQKIKELENIIKNNHTEIINFLNQQCQSDSLVPLAHELINAVTAYLLFKLTNVKAENFLHLLKNRKPVFYSFFHPVHQLRMGLLIEECIERNDLHNLSRDDKFLMMSLILMGVDPLVTSLVSAKITGLRHHHLEVPSVSFITRKSVAPITLKNQTFDIGTTFNLTIVPNEKQFNNSDYCPMNFGYGAHKCLGAHLSKNILEVAQQYLLNQKVDNINIGSVQVMSEGSFMRIEYR